MTPRPAIRAVHVVIPAHDEEGHIGPCLDSVRAATDLLGVRSPEVAVHTTLVLDRCRDRTAAIARARHVNVVAADAGSVGAARRIGVERAAALSRLLDPRQVLIVNTDADCRVPLTWLADHLLLAADHDLVQGEVSPDPDGLSPAALAEWLVRNPPGRGSLHGANLGFRLDAYLAAGGFPDVGEHEDLLLVRAMRAAGASSVGGTTVITSSRRAGRVAGGFAGYLRQLDLDLETGAPSTIGRTGQDRAGQDRAPRPAER